MDLFYLKTVFPVTANHVFQRDCNGAKLWKISGRRGNDPRPNAVSIFKFDCPLNRDRVRGDNLRPELREMPAIAQKEGRNIFERMAEGKI